MWSSKRRLWVAASITATGAHFVCHHAQNAAVSSRAWRSRWARPGGSALLTASRARWASRLQAMLACNTNTTGSTGPAHQLHHPGLECQRASSRAPTAGYMTKNAGAKRWPAHAQTRCCCATMPGTRAMTTAVPAEIEHLWHHDGTETWRPGSAHGEHSYTHTCPLVVATQPGKASMQLQPMHLAQRADHSLRALQGIAQALDQRGIIRVQQCG